MKSRLIAIAALAAATAFVPAVTLAAGDSDSAPAATVADADFEAGKAAIRSQNWSAAIGHFSKVVARDPQNAGAQNWLGYANRKSGNLDLAFKHYDEALRLDPKHRGAHEYIGEAYLMKGDVAKAKEHLATLDRICFFGCEEYSDLKKAIAQYEQRTMR
ncbi:MAG TPA: tetratricopeptide repeat protein [Gammaproteobacteria bacterium]